ncbi:MAG: coproporphyrinogen dehydrogenase HemZ [Lachnospira sp.]
MIYIDIDNELFYDDAVVLVRSFFPRTEVAALKQDTHVTDGDEILKVDVPDVTGLEKKDAHELFKDRLYRELAEKTGKNLPWGYLTGVRPSKIAYTMLEEGISEEQITKHFTDKHYASGEKAKLALTVAKKELDILTKTDYKAGYSLYIGIPFCPSICLYCSFSSYALGAYKDYVDSYLDALIKEIHFVADAMKGKRLDTVYIGGGTPTTLSASQLDRLLTEVENAFDLSHCLELTVEAGRPDSVSLDKFKVLKNHKVGRISINPQTMNQKTLDLIGRKHTVEEIKTAYSLAREAGLNNINMDMILGLPGEGVLEVEHTLNEIKALAPESLTVHSLAIKRASRLNILREQYAELSIENTDSIIQMTEQTARELNMEPYYMYRQKNMAGNFENVGYSVAGKECIYNILIMEEKQTIIACGAGASSKIVFHNESDDNHAVRIERIENVKDVRSYVERIDEMIERKRKFFEENELFW